MGYGMDVRGYGMDVRGYGMDIRGIRGIATLCILTLHNNNTPP